MTEVKPPTKFNSDGRLTIFLAGSIDQGTARDWQKDLTLALKNFNVLIYNPRRDDWDSTWEQSIHNPQFVEQVTWEQHYLHEADYRVFVITSTSKAPITLMELGQYLTKPGIVLCEDGFYRKANVQINAKLSGMPLVDTMEELIAHLKVILTEQGWAVNNE